MAAYSGVRHIRRHADAQHRTRWKRTPHPRDRLAKNRKKLEARGHLCRRSPSRKSAFRAAKLQAAPSPPNGVNINLGEAPPVPLTCIVGGLTITLCCSVCRCSMQRLMRSDETLDSDSGDGSGKKD